MSERTPNANQVKEEQTEGQKAGETSIFFQQYAVWVLLVFLIIAIWFQFTPLILVSTFLLFLSFFISTWKKHSLKNIEPTLKLSKSRLFADDEFTIASSIYNHKWLPLIWVEWEFQKSKAITIGEAEHENQVIRFLWLLSYQRVNWTVAAKAHQRGVYNLGNVTIRSGDGFRFAETEENHNLEALLYVYPKIVPVHIPLFRPSMQWEIKGKQGGLIEDPLLISGIRDYQLGDELRKFNWKASARTGRLQTNVYQPVVNEQLMVYADISGFEINENLYREPEEFEKYQLKKEEQFESFLSVVASVLMNYNQQGIRIGYASNADSYQGEKMALISPTSDIRLLLDQIAKTSQKARRQDRFLAELAYKGMGAAPIFIFCDRVTKEHYLWVEQYKQKLADVRFFYRQESNYTQKVKAQQLDTLLAPSRSVAKEG